MRSFIYGLILCVLLSGQFGCSGDSAPENTNTPIANTATAIATPLPQFTDANEALAAGDKLLEASETDMAIEAYNQALTLNPEFAEAYFKLGVAYALVEARDAAIVDNEEPTPTPGPKVKKPKEKKSNSDIAFEKAVERYKKQIAKNGEDDAAHYNLGRSYNKLNEDEDAAKSLKEAVKHRPDDTEYQTELGAILIKLAKYAEAIPALKKALELDPENIKAEELLADAEAGRKRIGFSTANKQDVKRNIGRSNTSTNKVPGDNANKSSTPANTVKTLPPANTL
ncbi:MAG: tetratricopeptide repeat protein [Pyrinomonadaceae bacterium]